MIGGTIIHGDGVGKKLGYPTANIDCKASKIYFDEGVYAAKAFINGKEYLSGVIIRHDPCKVEVHLLDHSGEDIYGQYLDVEPVQRVSSIENYEDKEELKKKIAADLVLVRKVFEDE